jgi:hypothetical protein
MNSDPYDSAAWRTFGMLDADESAIFDEAMRHDPLLREAFLEMNRLSGAIAAATTVPIEPRVGQLERLRARLGLDPAPRRSHWWLGISGWAAAAVLAVMMILGKPRAVAPGVAAVEGSGSGPAASAPRVDGASPAAPSQTDAAAQPGALARNPTDDAASAQAGGSTASPPQTGGMAAAAGATRAETKRLVQEIAVLRENLEKFQHRERILFDTVPGMALPVVMTMMPPGVEPADFPSLAARETASPITALLGDALAALTGAPKGRDFEIAGDALGSPGSSAQSTTLPAARDAVAPAGDPAGGQPTADGTEAAPPLPSAIPIYDVARDAGTLVVSHLPQTGEGEAYNLWVKTEAGGPPVYVGSLPETSESGTDSFDFSLGSTMVLPSGFVLTKDPLDAPQRPGTANTVLEGPPMGDR